MKKRMRLAHLGRTASLFCLAALFCLCLSSTVAAAKRDWTDREYDFSQARRILLFDLNTAKMPDSPVDRRQAEDIFTRAVQNKLGGRLISLEEAAHLLGSQLDTDVTSLLSSDREKAAALIREHVQQVADVWIEGRVDTWEDDSFLQPAYTEWEQRAYTRILRDSEGKTYEETYYVTVPVYYPARQIWYSGIQVTFEVRDAASGRLLMAREDDRGREGSHQQDSMFKRICNSFYSDLAKKIRIAEKAAAEEGKESGHDNPLRKDIPRKENSP